MRRRLGPQVLKLLRRTVATEYLVAVRVATEARYDVAGSLGLRNPELGAHSEVVGALAASSSGVANAALVESEIPRVTQGKPEEKTLRGPQLAVHPQVDAFDG